MAEAKGLEAKFLFPLELYPCCYRGERSMIGGPRKPFSFLTSSASSVIQLVFEAQGRNQEATIEALLSMKAPSPPTDTKQPSSSSASSSTPSIERRAPTLTTAATTVLLPSRIRSLPSPHALPLTSFLDPRALEGAADPRR